MVMALRTWLLFCATDAVLCVTPGPAVLLVVSQAISKGTWSGIAATLGILAANVVYFALSATGVSALLLGSARAFVVLKWLGAAYLIWMGARMILARPVAPTLSSDAVERSARSAFSLAVVTQGANPKALIFFAAILPQFVNPAIAVVPQVVILGVTSIAIEFIVLGVYVATCHAARGVVRQPRFAVTLQRLGGTFLVAAGAGLALIT
jgi:homoserine/homoserine lactone efflux protein